MALEQKTMYQQDIPPIGGDTKNLLEKYPTLSPLYQKILQIRSLIVNTKHRYDLFNYLIKADLQTERGEKLHKANFKIIVGSLIRAGFLDTNGNLNPNIQHSLAALTTSRDNPHAREILAIIKKVLGIRNRLDFIYGINWYHYQTIHLAIYTNDVTPFFDNGISPIKYCWLLLGIVYRLTHVDVLDANWLKTRPPIIQAYIWSARLRTFYGSIVSLTSDIKPLSAYYRNTTFITNINSSINNSIVIPPYIYSKLLQINLCMGLLEPTQKICESFTETSFYQQEALGALAFFRRNIDIALRHYGNAIKLFHSLADKREWSLDNIHVFFYVLALLYQENFSKINSTMANLKKPPHHEAIACVLEVFVYIKKNDLISANQSLLTANLYIEKNNNEAPFLLAVYVWANCLLEPQKITANANEYKKKFLENIEISHYLAAHIYAELVVASNINDIECSLFLDKTSPFSLFSSFSSSGPLRFLNIISIKQTWEYAINQLHQIVADKPLLEGSKPEFLAEKRLVWLLHPDNLHIEVAEQRLRKDRKDGKNGKWSEGKLVALKRFYRPDTNLNYLSEQDKVAIHGGLRQESYGWYEQTRFYLDPRHTLKNLIGHPLVFHAENRNINLELIKGDLAIQVEKTANGYHLSLPYHSDTPRIILERETTNRYRVIDFPDDFVAIAKIIPKRGLTVPSDAKEKIISIIGNAKSGIRINSDIEDDNLPTVPGDTTCCIHLFPIGDGMKLNIWMRPLGAHSHYYRAGRGQNRIIADITTESGEKIRQKAIRDFAQEKESVRSLINNCSTLAELDEKNDEWYLESVETCLELLLELEEYKKSHPLSIEWPKGQNLKLKQVVSFDNLSLSIKGKQDWFEYEGEIKLDHNLVLDMKSLLDLFDSYGNHGRFIRLADGEFIALTERFKQHLEELKAISEGNRVYRLGTGILQSLAEDTVQTTSDQSWNDHINKLQSMKRHSSVIPSTLQANLREYQEVGFRYLSRLANWKIGACLADDMGVGKTVQAIALLLELAPQGPILVVAPTSVCFIWMEELTKFAPTLNAYTLNTVNDRETLINSIDKMDVLICSYHLLLQVEDTILKKVWRVVVLDEAQAIKNHYTKRWQCVTKLTSNCRIALTGTPIENHLGELWSIFRFLNPGLLGSLQSFQDRYAIPIEKHRDPIAKRSLKNLVCPYILRRTKTEVLKELPPKTEQSILIEPTAEEVAFYEAVRIKALQRLQRLEDTDTQSNNINNNSKRFSILAEITRLRQACCHSSLVDENVNLENSKIKTFLTITKNLLDNNHKALVFSQYVRYLEKIKKTLDNEKITYQYLDGSTPLKERQEAVRAFQQGEGELFLISLKAGGAGLNLTAADYVIILDPWWNPAVENQASDRAHRIGQERPVTVYRLIMKNSIEEKIVKLHKDKKDLADDLLSGSDISGKITEEELMKLMEA